MALASAQPDLLPLVVWGAGGHARVVVDILHLGGGAIAGILDDRPLEHPDCPREFCGHPVLGGREILAELPARGVRSVIIAVGDCKTRLELADLVLKAGLRLITAVHPATVVAADVTLGSGAAVMAGAVVNPGCRLGACVIVNTHATVDHDCVLDDGVHVCPAATLGGGVTVGRGAWIGIGSTVKDHIRIGAGALVGAGAVVVRDIPANVVAYGVPAQVIRKID